MGTLHVYLITRSASYRRTSEHANRHFEQRWYNRGMPIELRIGDVVQLRKPHPCGGYEWEIVRVGADIGIRCCQCRRRVLLPRRQLERQIKAFVRRGEPAEPSGV